MNKILHPKLLDWYRAQGRHHLPWRQTDDPYRIWVSEIMLQQTQVKTVFDRFYFPFFERFPTLSSLADAPLDDVLKRWEGLGYYTRAKNLHQTAQICTPQLPKTVEELLALPGIGKSTAHAIAAFAYRTPVPILDANVKRILYRFFGRKNADEKTLWRLAGRLFDTAHPYEYNQAMMDIGATICLPRSARCDACPLQSGCKAANRDPLGYPAAKKRKPIPLRRRHIVIYRDGDRYGLRQRDGSFLHGLWGFSEQTASPDPAARKLGKIVQIYSHFRLEADVWIVNEKRNELTFHTPAEIESLALGNADRKVLKLLANVSVYKKTL